MQKASGETPPGADGVDDALVDGPELLPLLQRHVLGGALAQDELLERLQLQPPPEYALQSNLMLISRYAHAAAALIATLASQRDECLERLQVQPSLGDNLQSNLTELHKPQVCLKQNQMDINET